MSLSALNSQAQTTKTPNCDDIIRSCKDALEYSDYVINALKRERQIQSDLLIIKDDRIKDLEAWYRQPEILITIGIVIGIGLRK